MLLSLVGLCVGWASDGKLLLGILILVAVRWHLELGSSEGLIGLVVQNGFFTHVSCLGWDDENARAWLSISFSPWSPLHVAGLGFLTVWESEWWDLHMVVHFTKVNIATVLGGNCKALDGVGSAVMQCDFCHILLIKSKLQGQPRFKGWGPP